MLVRAAVFGLAYFAGAEIGYLLSHDGQEPIFWPPAGLFLASLVLSERRAWPAMLAAALVASLVSNALFHDKSLPLSLGLYTANCAAACAGAWLLGRFLRPPIALATIRDVLGLSLLAALSCAVGATIGAAVLSTTFGQGYGPAWPAWWLSDALGVLVVAPVVLTAARCGSFPQAWRRRLAEGAFLFLGLVVTSQAVYGEWLAPPFNVPILILPFLLWAAVRFGPPGAAAALLMVALIGVWNVSQGRGPFMALTAAPSQHLLRVQGSLGLITLCVLILAAAVAERAQTEREKIKLISELEQALAEIKTLRGLIPLCAWCKKMRDDAGSWQGLEDYLSTHTDAQVTHGVCPECMEKQLTGMTSRGPAGNDTLTGKDIEKTLE
ncbi:MAG: MASE1 domain-containing protein [Gemmataceae bacterium]